MSIRTTNFDALAAAAPLDRQASVIRDGSGDLWDGRVQATQAHWKAPPIPVHERPEDQPDLTGLRQGRLTAIRYHETRTKPRRHQWLVRCDCGDYEVRRAEVIADHRGEHEACCQACDWLRIIRNRVSGPYSVARRKADEAMLGRLAEGQR